MVLGRIKSRVFTEDSVNGYTGTIVRKRLKLSFFLRIPQIDNRGTEISRIHPFLRNF